MHVWKCVHVCVCAHMCACINYMFVCECLCVRREGEACWKSPQPCNTMCLELVVLQLSTPVSSVSHINNLLFHQAVGIREIMSYLGCDL